MLFSSLPIDTVYHILDYTGTFKLRNGKYMGQIPLTDKRYELLRNIPKMIIKHCWSSFSIPGEIMYIISVSFTNKDHYLELIVNEYNSRARRVTAEYNNDIRGFTRSYFRT